MDNSELNAAKARLDLLLRALGKNSAGHHQKCSFHEDSVGSMSVYQSSGGAWLFKCHASGCGKSGTVVDAVMHAEKTDLRSAIRRVLEMVGAQPSPRTTTRANVDSDVSDSTPTIDRERAVEFVKKAHIALLSDFESYEEYAVNKRGISEETICRFMLGFVKDHLFPGWGTWRIFGWVLPVFAGSDGELLAVKIHTERQVGKQPKCLWAPFGIASSGQGAKHGMATLWPPPEAFPGGAVVLCPGELKALSLISSGVQATAITGGEGWIPPPKELLRLRRFDSVAVTWDDDELKWRSDYTSYRPGTEWRDKVMHALETMSQSGLGFRVRRYLSWTEIRRAAGLRARPEPEPEPRQDVPHEQPEKTVAPSSLEAADAEWQKGIKAPVADGIDAGKAYGIRREMMSDGRSWVEQGLPLEEYELLKSLREHDEKKKEDKADWTPRERELIEWFESFDGEIRTPAVLSCGTKVANYGLFRKSLLREISLGPRSPGSLMGRIRRTLESLLEIIDAGIPEARGARTGTPGEADKGR